MVATNSACGLRRSICSPAAVMESAAVRTATCLENRDGEVTLGGSTPQLSAHEGAAFGGERCMESPLRGEQSAALTGSLALLAHNGRSSTARTASLQGAGAGSAPARPTMPPGSAGDDAGFSDQKAGFDPPWRYSMRGRSRGRAPGSYPGGCGIVSRPRSYDACAARRGTLAHTPTHSSRT